MEFDFSGDITMREIASIKATGLPVVLFGFGGAIFRMCDELFRIGLDIRYIVDNDEKKQGNTWENLKIISFSELINTYSDCHIIITVSQAKYVDEIRTQILEDGHYNKIHYFQTFYPFGERAKAIIEGNRKKIEKVYDLMADQKSKDCFENKINYMLTKNVSYLKCNTEEEEYFPTDIFMFGRKEFFIDGGAFHGENTEQLMKYVDTLKAVCIEPDKTNFNILKNRMNQYNNIDCLNSALWSNAGKIKFAQSGSMGSTVNERGDISVNAISIDELSHHEGENISFIKMDVEGAEIEALEGGYNVISSISPKLAICVYHKIEHHWEIPLLINSMNEKYNIYMRQHPHTGIVGEIETVCYAEKS